MTANVKAGGPGMTVDLMLLCGTASKPHKGSRVGAHMRGNMPWRCAACVVAQAKERVCAPA
jgi:hypothetical protein